MALGWSAPVPKNKKIKQFWPKSCMSVGTSAPSLVSVSEPYICFPCLVLDYLPGLLVFLVNLYPYFNHCLDCLFEYDFCLYFFFLFTFFFIALITKTTQ